MTGLLEGIRIVKGIGKAGDTVVTSCETGPPASVVHCAVWEPGLKARLDDGSGEEWSRWADLPGEPEAAK